MADDRPRKPGKPAGPRGGGRPGRGRPGDGRPDRKRGEGRPSRGGPDRKRDDRPRRGPGGKPPGDWPSHPDADRKRPDERPAVRRARERKREDEKRPRRPRPVATVVLATHNRGKLGEILDRLRDLPIYFQLLDDLPVRVTTPVEDAPTFVGNARKKALHYVRYTDQLVIAEDSGLSVDALDGAPGVRSARFAGAGATDADRIRLLLTKLDGVRWDYRTARFVCATAVARGGKILASFEGVSEGRITLEPTGSAGFGYDPIFHHDGAGRTFAEMTRDEKFKVSHRGRALEQLERWLRDHLGIDTGLASRGGRASREPKR